MTMAASRSGTDGLGNGHHSAEHPLQKNQQTVLWQTVSQHLQHLHCKNKDNSGWFKWEGRLLEGWWMAQTAQIRLEGLKSQGQCPQKILPSSVRSRKAGRENPLPQKERRILQHCTGAQDLSSQGELRLGNYTCTYIFKSTEGKNSGMYTNGHSSIVHNRQKVETTQMSIARRMEKQNVMNTYHGISFNLKEK